MKQPEYIEGPEALENFKRGMAALFKVAKSVVQPVMKKSQSKSTTGRKKKKADNGRV